MAAKIAGSVGGVILKIIPIFGTIFTVIDAYEFSKRVEKANECPFGCA